MSALHSHSYFDCFWGESCLFSLCAVLYSYCILTFISHFPFSSLSLFLQLLLFFVWKLFSKKELMILLLLLLHICLYFVYYRAWIHKISKKASHFEDLIQATFSVPDFPKQKFPFHVLSAITTCHSLSYHAYYFVDVILELTEHYSYNLENTGNWFRISWQPTL